MKDHRTTYGGKRASAQAPGVANLPRRIFVVDGDMGICPSSAEVRIR
ncbi:MAG: hypothetical protein NT154_01585 [Verrucomicrobia bacterium]|nr:hypothetical protein [Verrucomicrobiota bacterium]